MDISRKADVSVIMITYNHEEYIGKAIEGVLHQDTEYQIELLISDDCSNDRTRDIVEKYRITAPDVIKTLHSPKNLGAKKNLLKLERFSKAEFLAYCEGDDYWHDDSKIQKQIRFLKDNPDYGMVHSWSLGYWVEKNKSKNGIINPKNLDDGNAYNEILTGIRHIWTPTVCVRSDLLKGIIEECPECSDPKWPMGDTQRWLELAKRSKVKCIAENLATRSFLSESASQSKDARKILKFKIKGKNLIDHYLRKYPVALKTERRVRSRVNIAVLKAAFYAGDRKIIKTLIDESRIMRLHTSPIREVIKISLRGQIRRQIAFKIISFFDLYKKGINKINRIT